MQEEVYTIGHSTLPEQRFVDLLLQQRVTALCDVRSQPYSRVNPQFNREALKQSLRRSGIRYVFLGKELGARSEDPTCYERGKVRYELLAQTDLFQQGLDRLKKGMKNFRLALMCAEKEPLDCHRTILIARHLVARGVDVSHIHPNGKIETHPDTMSRLVRMLNLSEGDMFRSREELLADAYRHQEERIAYDSGLDVPQGVSNAKILTR